MQMILVIIILCSLYYFSAYDKKDKKEDNSDLVCVRAAQEDMIERWLSDMRRGSGSRKIAEWSYIKGSSDMIRCRFLGEEEFIVGKLFFTCDGGFPRVLKMKWIDKYGVVRHISGTPIPKIEYSSLVNSFRMAKKDAGKLKYLNQTAAAAQQNGDAILDICEYERISPKVFHETFGQDEIKAFCEVMAEEFEILDVKDNRLMVKLATEL